MQTPVFTRFSSSGALALLSFGAVAAAILMQMALSLTPCPLCIFQRVLYLTVGVAALFSTWRPMRTTGLAFATLASLAGLSVAGWHTYIQANPAMFSTCTPGVSYLFDNFPLADILPILFKGGGQCFHVDRTFFGATIPQMSIAAFLTCAVVAARGVARSIKAGRS